MSVLPDPLTVRGEPCPEGWRYEWVPEAAFGWLGWRVVDPADSKRCRFTAGGHRCEASSVAKIQRGHKDERWWHYCADHLYGRKVAGRRVWVIHTIRVDSAFGDLNNG